MTDRTCPLGDDCDLTVAWLAGAEQSRATIRALRAECGDWRRTSIDTWAAMQAMRNSINDYIPMPSLESDLLQGPENSIFCATIAEAVINCVTGNRDETAALRADIAKLAEALRIMGVDPAKVMRE